MLARDRVVLYRTLTIYAIVLFGVLLYLGVAREQPSGLLLVTIVFFALAIGFKMWLLSFIQRREIEVTWVIKALDVGLDILYIVIFASAYVVIGRLS